MGQSNNWERAYLQGFRAGYRQARLELQGEADELLEKLREGMQRLDAEWARLDGAWARLDAVWAQLDAVRTPGHDKERGYS